MINRSVHMIFEPSGKPIPTEEEVRLEACEIVQRSGWGLPLIERLRKMADPYWREAVARCLLDQWNKLVRDMCLARTGDNIDRLCDTSTPDAPIVIVNVIINEEHHYHKGAVHNDKSTHITLK